MNRHTRRRIGSSALLAILIASAACGLRWADHALWRSTVWGGYLLYASVLFLAAYNLRKKLPGAWLGSSAAWLQAHVYVGVATLGLYLLHAGPRVPDGWLEGALAGVYGATFVSGVWGLYLSRSIPPQLRRTGEQYIYERIPGLRQRGHSEGNTAVLAAVSAAGATTLADFYATRLYDYLAQPRGLIYWLRPTGAKRRRLMRELGELARLLSEAESHAAEKLFALLRRKDDLDFHEARQGLLKGWLFVHIALSWSLLTLGALHGVLATAFRGDLP
ncbi:hypothetical protein Pla175_06430 [Pirellulimonas nuda]|uniref:Uncharacterized protein n=1 Tax=Pirellulimonas nuda TaxID=2528009 RepID=A0A518D724_9BACT|nr:hypothetical protein [Pirellulimonas nuda]QDU87284.1 hypothetical protein Pla175_06430 [Pirellulimonas nuda]